MHVIVFSCLFGVFSALSAFSVLSMSHRFRHAGHYQPYAKHMAYLEIDFSTYGIFVSLIWEPWNRCFQITEDLEIVFSVNGQPYFASMEHWKSMFSIYGIRVSLNMVQVEPLFCQLLKTRKSMFPIRGRHIPLV